MREHVCPVCYESLDEHGGLVSDNALGCPRGHNVCTACVRQLVRPKPTHSHATQQHALVFDCPMCRVRTRLSPFHMMVLVKGSWHGARACFECDEDQRKWMGV